MQDYTIKYTITNKSDSASLGWHRVYGDVNGLMSRITFICNSDSMNCSAFYLGFTFRQLDKIDSLTDQ